MNYRLSCGIHTLTMPDPATIEAHARRVEVAATLVCRICLTAGRTPLVFAPKQGETVKDAALGGLFGGE